MKQLLGKSPSGLFATQTLTGHVIRGAAAFALLGGVTMKRSFRLLAAAVLCAGCAPDLKPAHSVNDSGNVWFATADSLARKADEPRLVMADPVDISGDLSFPSGSGPFPAVVLAHGCEGLGNAEAGWAPILREWGYATFVIDSLLGRGLKEVCTSATTLTGTQRIPDAYGALRILAAHPKVDPARVALMGFSHGGILTMGASTAWAKETFAPAGRPAFRAFFAFYPFCNIVYPERERISGPVRIHTGELDDWTPAGPCVHLAQQLKGSGQDAMATVYPGAHHGFDNIGRSLLYLPNVDSAANCSFKLASILGPFPPPSVATKCFRKGATIAWSPEATEQARHNVRTQLAELLR
jgi:dienelactone hydrolase